VTRVLSSAHNHTRYVDGKNTVQEMAKAALDKGFVSLGFSEHGRQPHDAVYGLSLLRESAYRAEVMRLKGDCAGRMKVWLGIERDSLALSDRSIYDYVIGAMHYLPCAGGYLSVDGEPEGVRRLIDTGYGGDPYAMTADYFRRYADYVTGYKPDIIAHFDLVKKLNQRHGFFSEEDPRYDEPALDALERMAETGALLEVNTGAVARGWRTDPYPSARLLTRWRELSGRTIVSGDCHDADYIDCAFDLCVQMLKGAGFTEVWRLGTGDDLFEPVPLT
jgi:histidinol-phosphatase (PHP family)